MRCCTTTRQVRIVACAAFTSTQNSGARNYGRAGMAAMVTMVNGEEWPLGRELPGRELLLLPAVEKTLSALDPPDSDGALAALVRRQAAVIDAMPDAVAAAMMPNHGGAAAEGPHRTGDARGETAAGRVPGRPSKLDQLRAAHRSGKTRGLPVTKGPR